MKIFTSYFGIERKIRDAGVVPISIALWKPRWYDGLCLQEAAPKSFMVHTGLPHERYIWYYRHQILDRLDAAAIVRRIRLLSGGRDAALLCYERPGDFCHRHLLAEWITENTGTPVTEWHA